MSTGSMMNTDMTSRIKKAKEVAEVLFQNKYFESAVEILQQVCAIQEAEFGKLHPDVISTKQEVIPVLTRLKKYAGVSRVYEDVCNLRIKLPEGYSGSGPPDSSSKLLLGCFLQWETKYDDAVKVLQEDNNAKVVTFGPRHPCTRTVKYYVATCLELSGKLEDAKTIFGQLSSTLNHSSETIIVEEFMLAMSISRILNKQKHYDSALKILQQLQTSMEGLVPEDHEAVLAVRLNTALVLNNQGKYTQALMIFEEVLDVGKRSLPHEHGFIENIILENGHALLAAGEAEDALEKYETVIEDGLKSSELDHSRAINDLKGKYRALKILGRYAELVEVCQRICTFYVTGFGKFHPLTLVEKRRLAKTMERTGDFEGAGSLHEELCDLNRLVYGHEHEETLESKSNLGVSYTHSSRLEEGFDLLKQVLVVHLQKHGEQNAITMKTLSRIGSLMCVLGKYEGGLSAMKQSLYYFKPINSDENMESVRIKKTMAKAFCMSGQIDMAISMYREVVNWYCKEKGEANYHTLMSKLALADTIRIRDREEAEATEIFAGIHDGILKIFGPDNLISSFCRFTKGIALVRRRDFEGGLKALREDLAEKSQRHGPNSGETIVTRTFISHALTGLGRLEEALESSKETYAIHSSINQDPRDEDSQKIRGLIGTILESLAMYEQAAEVFEDVLSCRLQFCPPDDKQTMSIQLSLGENYLKQGKFQDSFRVFQKLYGIQSKKLGTDHSDTWHTKFCLGISLGGIGNSAQAFKIFEEIYTKRRNSLGENHPETKNVKQHYTELKMKIIFDNLVHAAAQKRRF